MDTEHNVHNTLAIPVSEILTQQYVRILAIILPVLMICGDGILSFIGFMYHVEECAGVHVHVFEDTHPMSFNEFFRYGGIAGCVAGIVNVFPKLLKLKHSCNCCSNANENERNEDVKCMKCLYHWSTGDGYLAIFIILWVVYAFTLNAAMIDKCRLSTVVILLQFWCAIKIAACVLGILVLCVAAIVAANSGPKNN